MTNDSRLNESNHNDMSSAVKSLVFTECGNQNICTRRLHHRILNPRTDKVQKIPFPIAVLVIIFINYSLPSNKKSKQTQTAKSRFRYSLIQMLTIPNI